MNVCLIFILIVQSLYATSSATSLQTQLCKLKKVTGPCRASMAMYYYDQRQGKCLQFIYGGCGGNKNRFKTLKDCKKQCDPGKEEKCERACTFIYMPVCGSDGKTYASQCVLDVANCKSDGSIKKVHDGECKKKCVRPCPMIFSPVCGSDGKTYPSVCELEVADCLSDGSIKKVHDGVCKPKCPEICTMEYNPQCGSDDKTYSNPCALKIATCKSNGRITLAHEGECDVCSMKKNTGPCRAYFPRYYYNGVSTKCESFIYGGCLGNGNNFVTMQECQKKCGHF